MITRTKKVFVGGLSAQTTLEDVRAYFEQFGLVSSTRKRYSQHWQVKLQAARLTCQTICIMTPTAKIEDAMLMFDKQTNRHRGKFPSPRTFEVWFLNYSG